MCVTRLLIRRLPDFCLSQLASRRDATRSPNNCVFSVTRAVNNSNNDNDSSSIDGVGIFRLEVRESINFNAFLLVSFEYTSINPVGSRRLSWTTLHVCILSEFY